MVGGKIKRKMVKLDEIYDGKVDVGEACKGVSEEKNRFRGASKTGNKWQARVRHPMLKNDVYLGSYSSREEAALVAKEKRAEFEEMFKGNDSATGKTRGVDFEKGKLPLGVYRRGYERWEARVWHPKFKKNKSLGSYKTVEEAAAAVNKKRAELSGIYWVEDRKARVIAECEEDDKVVYQPECEAVSTSELLDEQTGDVKVPAGVRRMKSGKWGARITDPKWKARIWLGSYDKSKDAVKYINSIKAVLDAKTEKAKFDECEFRYTERSVSEAEYEFGYECPASALHTEKPESIAPCERSKYGVTDVERSKYGVTDDHSSSYTIFEPENSSSEDLSDRSALSQKKWQIVAHGSSAFDEAVSLGFINEYGQLLGKYSELDEQMGLRTF